MSRIICIIGNKGGTGKTTLSHMLCQGFGLLGQRSACVLTDTSREPLSPDGRRYVTADGRSPEALHKVVSKLRTMQGWIGVVDGGGNRSDVDKLLESYADIVLLLVSADFVASEYCFALMNNLPCTMAAVIFNFFN